MSRFVGQARVINELSIIARNIQSGSNFNLLFFAPSGWGKTTLALKFLHMVGNEQNVAFYIPNKDTINFRESCRFHFIDEVHTLDSPEMIYPLMDSGNYTFLLATNESGMISEPLIRRCIQFIFEPYTNQDYREMITNSELMRYNFNSDMIDYLVSIARTPGYLKIIIQRLVNVLRVSSSPPRNLDELLYIIEYILSIDKNGFTYNEKRYIKALLQMGNRSSLERIVAYTRIPRVIILRDIEPFLLEKGVINITSRGRELMEN